MSPFDHLAQRPRLEITAQKDFTEPIQIERDNGEGHAHSVDRMARDDKKALTRQQTSPAEQTAPPILTPSREDTPRADPKTARSIGDPAHFHLTPSLESAMLQE